MASAKHRQVFPDVPTMRGQYSCEAQNPQILASSSAMVTVVSENQVEIFSTNKKKKNSNLLKVLNLRKVALHGSHRAQQKENCASDCLVG